MQLRTKRHTAWGYSVLPAETRIPLQGVAGLQLDIEVVLCRGHSVIAGVMLESWSSAAGATAILYDWDNRLLEVRIRARLQCLWHSPRNLELSQRILWLHAQSNTITSNCAPLLLHAMLPSPGPPISVLQCCS